MMPSWLLSPEQTPVKAALLIVMLLLLPTRAWTATDASAHAKGVMLAIVLHTASAAAGCRMLKPSSAAAKSSCRTICWCAAAKASCLAGFKTCLHKAARPCKTQKQLTVTCMSRVKLLKHEQSQHHQV